MTTNLAYEFLADAVLALHFGVVVFVVGGLVAILIGNRIGWRWVNGWFFRLAHLIGIAIVAAQAWLGLACPLTTLESWLRLHAGAPGYATSFVGYWIERIVFIDAPLWVFTLAYSVFALLVVGAWWRYPPRRETRRSSQQGIANLLNKLD